MIKIFYCTSDLTSVPDSISQYRKDKIIAAKNPLSRLTAIRSALILRAGFSSFGIEEKDINYVIGDHGKPCASNYPEIHFSLTHTDDISICAFYDNEIGMDCENITRNIDPKTLRRFFSESECTAHKDSSLLLWVSKEALVKHSGKGFANGRHDHSVPAYTDETTVNGLWLKRLEICGALTVVCTASKDDISITEVSV